MAVGIYNGSAINVRITNGETTVRSVLHEKIHFGDLFTAWNVDDSLASSASINVFLRPTGESLHIRVAAEAGGDATLEMFEDPTTTADGTTFTPVNHRRIDPIPTLQAGVFTDATVTVDGTQLMEYKLPGGSGGNAAGAGAVAFGEMITEVGKEYLIRLTNDSGQAQIAAVHVELYEEDLEARFFA